MSFEPGDFNSGLWVRLRKHYEERLGELRAKNDAPLSAEETAAIRGRIAEIKRLLDLDAPPPEIVNRNTGF